MDSGYQEVYARWHAEPEAFWREASGEVAWIKPPQTIFEPASGVYGTWFPDATCNTCFNALDRHVEAGRGDQVALIYDSPLTGQVRRFTYTEMQEEVAVLGAVLEDLGIGAGDRVVIYMPMCARR